MADNNAVKVTYGSVGTTAETSYLTQRWNQVAITNRHATATMACRVFTSDVSAAAAAALADATDAVELADENFSIPPVNGRRIVFKSRQPLFVALSVIASATATYEVVGSTYFD